jgi:transposase
MEKIVSEGLKAAFEATKKLPAGWRSKKWSDKRASWLKGKLADKPHMTFDEAKIILRSEFGVGMDFTKFTRIRNEVKRSLEWNARRADKGMPSKSISPVSKRRVQTKRSSSTEDDVRRAARAVLGIIPNISKFNMIVTEEGPIKITWASKSESTVEIDND